MSVIILTTGQPGAGKSFSRVRWLVTDFLINSDGLYITNLPLNVELIAGDLSDKTGKPYDYYLDRLIVIPDDELKRWRDLSLLDKNELKKIKDDDGFLPAEFFDKQDLSGAHIAIDEFHRYCSKNDPLPLRKIWNDWFAEIRKLGCTFEAITQDISQLPRDFYGKVGVKIDLAPFGNTRDPFFGIKMFDWYQLKGGYFGVLESTVEQVESIRDASSSGSTIWKETKRDTFKLDDIYFKYYNSFQKSDNSEKKQDFSCPALKYKKLIIFWFLRRNFWQIFSRFFLVALFFWLCFGGGISMLINSFLNSSKEIAKANGTKIETRTNETPQVKRRRVITDSSIVDYSCYTPTLFLDTDVILTNGEKIYANTRLKKGPLKGYKIYFIDFKNRLYYVDSGYVFGMYER